MVENQFEQVSSSIWSHTTGTKSSRISYIELNHFLVAVDSGWHTNVTKKAREFIEHKTAKKVKYLILTHAHGDHIFGTKYFSDCEMIASLDTSILISKRIEERNNYKDKGIIINNTSLEYTLDESGFRHFEIEDDGDTIHVTETNSGHITGNLFVHYPKEDVVIAGDLLFSQLYPYGGELSASPYGWIKSFQKIIDLEPKHIVPGHGPIASIEDVKLTQKYFQDIVDAMENMVEQGMDKQEIIKSKNLPKFPWKTNYNWRKLLLEQFYKCVKEKYLLRTYNTGVEKGFLSFLEIIEHSHSNSSDFDSDIEYHVNQFFEDIGLQLSLSKRKHTITDDKGKELDDFEVYEMIQSDKEKQRMFYNLWMMIYR